jgi:hypothetical protein
MASSGSRKIDVALVHYPVVNRTGELIGSAVTNLDLHDIARAGCTYGVDTYWVVTPDSQQQELVGKIIAHWTQGYGGSVNPDRKNALSLIRTCSGFDEVVKGMTEKWGVKPMIIATCARPGQRTVEYEAVRNMIAKDKPLLLLFGTAWGLAPEMLAKADEILPPLRGVGEYNHLSVRSAVSIILDRLLGLREER